MDYKTKGDKRLKKHFKEKYKDYVVHKTMGKNRGIISKKKIKLYSKKSV